MGRPDPCDQHEGGSGIRGLEAGSVLIVLGGVPGHGDPSEQTANGAGKGMSQSNTTLVSRECIHSDLLHILSHIARHLYTYV